MKALLSREETGLESQWFHAGKAEKTGLYLYAYHIPDTFLVSLYNNHEVVIFFIFLLLREAKSPLKAHISSREGGRGGNSKSVFNCFLFLTTIASSGPEHLLYARHFAGNWRSEEKRNQVLSVECFPEFIECSLLVRHFTKELSQMSLGVENQSEWTCLLPYFSNNEKHMLRLFSSHS